MRMRHLLASLSLVLCGAAMPLGAQTGTVQVSLTIVEPTQATVEPAVSVSRAADGQVQVETHVNLRGAVAWSLAQRAVRPATLASAPEDADEVACGAWRGSAAAQAHGPRFGRRLTARATCAVNAGGTGRAPLVVVLAAN
ncbi:MAG TPA: hypothetical protein VF142_23125 [Longimicrobium sp.]